MDETSKYLRCRTPSCQRPVEIEDVYDKPIGEHQGIHGVTRPFAFGTCTNCGAYVEDRTDALKTLGVGER